MATIKQPLYTFKIMQEYVTHNYCTLNMYARLVAQNVVKLLLQSLLLLQRHAQTNYCTLFQHIIISRSGEESFVAQV